MSYHEEAMEDYKPDPANYVLPETDEEQLHQSQQIRQLAIATQTKNGAVIPTDKDEREFLIKMLDGKDKVSIQRLRLKTDGDKNANDAALAQQFAALSQHLVGQKPTAPVPGAEIPQFRSDLLPDIEVVPGQMDVGSHNISFAEMEEKHSTRKK